MVSYIPAIWAAILGVAVALYVVMDGYDLGVGMLFPFAKNEGERDQMMRSIGPFWDGNETWLVLGGGGLLAAFPLAYAVVMPALYLPVIVMLLGLIFRGIAFEFRTVSHSKKMWNVAFAFGSTVATFSQGVVLGGFIQGIKVENNAYAGGPFDWVTPFALFCGVALCLGYLLLGATWLVMKTEGAVAEQARARAKFLLLAVVACMAVVSLWTPFAHPRIAERWFVLPNILYLWPVPVVTALVAFWLGRSLEKGREIAPFIATIVLFLLGYLGLAVSSFPYLVPPSITVWQAAAAPASQIFLLLGTLMLLPIIIGYIVFVYWVFRGKVKAGESYEH